MIENFTNEEYLSAKSTDRLQLLCENCGKPFLTEKKQIKFEREHCRGRLKYCSKDCATLAKSKEREVFCENCGKKIKIKNNEFNNSKTKHFFCSHSCSAEYNNKRRAPVSEEQKKKTSESLKKYYNSHTNIHIVKKNPKTRITQYKIERGKEKICKVCGKRYYKNKDWRSNIVCSRECSDELRKNKKKYLSNETIEKLRAAGRHSSEIQAENRRSKNEKYFFELCKERFNSVKHNEAIFNGWDADIIIDDIKIAVLWNGKWHYEKITKKHSVKCVQNRDRIKMSEIKKYGYEPYVIKDMGKYNPSFVENEFQKFLKYCNIE